MTQDTEDWIVLGTAIVVLSVAILTIHTKWYTFLWFVCCLGLVMLLIVLLTHPE